MLSCLPSVHQDQFRSWVSGRVGPSSDRSKPIILAEWSMRKNLVLAVLCLAVAFSFSIFTKPVQAESTISCPSGTYDMLDWMTLDSNMRGNYHMAGSANPLYTNMGSGKFYWTKGAKGTPWDIQLYDSKYIYLWITELNWNDPHTFKKFANNTNMPLVP